jgi:hypothetical protein
MKTVRSAFDHSVMWPEILLKSKDVSMLVCVADVFVCTGLARGQIIKLGGMNWPVMPLKRTKFC